MPDVATIDAAFTPEIWPWISSVVLDGEVVLYDEALGRIHLLNDSGSLAWQLIDGATTIAEMGELLADATGAAVAEVTFDIVALVRMLADLGVLVGFDAAEVEPPGP